jgi:hypothetical protein
MTPEAAKVLITVVICMTIVMLAVIGKQDRRDKR